MKPLRKNLALAIDGGGIRGIIATAALCKLERALDLRLADRVTLTAGTSTGAIISAALACGLAADDIHQLYLELGSQIFPSTWRSWFFPLTRHRYTHEPLRAAFERYVGNPSLGEIWQRPQPMDMVLSAFDILQNKTCFIKPWKAEYRDWPLIQAVLASSSVPTYFPPVAGRYLDGGVGSYANPCYLAAYEALYVLNWDPAETTIISLGTGKSPRAKDAANADAWYAWQWVEPMLGAFLQSADDQQVALTAQIHRDLDFRRFQVDLDTAIPMDSLKHHAELLRLGERLGVKILRDDFDQPPDFKRAGQTPTPF